MYSTKVNQRGQITIPKKLREKYNLQPGSEVLFDEVDGHLVLEKGTVVPEWFAKMGPQLVEGLSDIRDKHYKDCDSIQEMVDDLNSGKK